MSVSTEGLDVGSSSVANVIDVGSPSASGKHLIVGHSTSTDTIITAGSSASGAVLDVNPSTPYETADFRNFSKSNEVLSLSETPVSRPDLLLSCKGCSFKSKWARLAESQQKIEEGHKFEGQHKGT